MKKRTISLLCVLILIGYPLFNLYGIFSKDYNSIKIKTNTDILDILSSQDIKEIENNIIKEKQNAEKEQSETDTKEEKNESELLLEQLENGEISYRKLFKDVCIVGDSLMNGLEAYNILNNNNLITQVSASLYHLADNKNKIVGMNPRVLILHYGLNMLETDSGQPGRFIAFYEELIKQLQQELPYTLIIVSSLFPVDSNKVQAKRFSKIEDYNEALKIMCENLEVEFLDNASLPEEAYQCYASDGIHLNRSFYENYWLKFIFTQKELVKWISY